MDGFHKGLFGAEGFLWVIFMTGIFQIPMECMDFIQEESQSGGIGLKQKVVVGMSGGVDSSVAAYLLKEQGYDVIGVTMRIWPDHIQASEASRSMDHGLGTGDVQRSMNIFPAAGGRSSGTAGGSNAGPKPETENCSIGQASAETAGNCCGLTAVEDAGRVAEVLNIPYVVMDFRQEFQHHVMDYFVEEYLRGYTPNPCIACNRYVKWEALLEHSRAVGADYIATGHYARIARLANGRLAVRSSVTAAKDQTYALYHLTQSQLAHTLMPVGEYEKSRIRAIAEKAGLPVAHKRDSQEICFVPDRDYAGFISRTAKEHVPGPGNFVDDSGNILGRHRGITHYTIGQRRGLELPMGERVYVTEIRPDTNEVVIGKDEDLFTREVLCHKMNYMSIEDLKQPMRVFGKIRYNHKGEYCTIEKQSDGSVLAVFEKPVRAAAPGQSVCFYDGEYVLGGGIIEGGGGRARNN